MVGRPERNQQREKSQSIQKQNSNESFQSNRLCIFCSGWSNQKYAWVVKLKKCKQFVFLRSIKLMNPLFFVFVCHWIYFPKIVWHILCNLSLILVFCFGCSIPRVFCTSREHFAVSVVWLKVSKCFTVQNKLYNCYLLENYYYKYLHVHLSFQRLCQTINKSKW